MKTAGQRAGRYSTGVTGLRGRYHGSVPWKDLKGIYRRDAIKCNFVIPAAFSMIWIALFSSASLYYEFSGQGLNETMLESGPESVVYSVFSQLPLSVIIAVFYVFIIFISIVTGSDTNTNAMQVCVRMVSLRIRKRRRPG